jgi:hypothetical protein
MKKIFFFVFITICFLTKSYSQDWITFKSAEGKFSVLLPAEPISQIDSSTASITKMLLAKNTLNEYFAIGWTDYESGHDFDAQEELEANRDNFIKGINGTLISTTNAKFSGYQAIEFVAQAGNFYWTSKVFLVGKRPYQLLVGSNTGKASEFESKFYNSFSIKND